MLLCEKCLLHNAKRLTFTCACSNRGSSPEYQTLELWPEETDK